MTTTYSIELDCPPGNPRPNDLIGSVLKDTGLEVSDFDTGTPFFGCQTWVLKNADKVETYKEFRPQIQNRVTQMYHRGMIRYGSW